MLGIRIKDSKRDLGAILPVIGGVLTSQWICRDLDYTMMKDDRLYEILNVRQKFSGTEFLQFADKVRQVIDGRFEARTKGPSKNLWLVIIVFDSSWVDVWTTKPDVLERLRARFKKIDDLSSEVMKVSLELVQGKRRG